MLWTFHFFFKKLWCRNRKKKKSDKLICGNSIVEIEGKKSDKLICSNSIAEIDHNKVICGTDKFIFSFSPCGSLFHDCKFCSMTEIVQDFVTCTHVHVC